MNTKELLYGIVYPKINHLVKKLGETTQKKTIHHYWKDLVCYFFPVYETEMEIKDDFIARLSFYSTGIRDRIYPNAKEDDVISEIRKIWKNIFLHSLKYEKQETKEICLEFAKEINEFFNKDVLDPNEITRKKKKKVTLLDRIKYFFKKEQ